jgi:1-acyl-sn-glycerol-3-phosphate acyltransferase
MPGRSGSLLLSLRNVGEVLGVCVSTIVDAARGRVTKELSDERLFAWSKRIVANSHIDLEMVGREHIRPGVTYLVMSNHESHYDIPMIYRTIGGSVRMVAKKELFSLPFFGPAIKIGGFVAIDRKNRTQAIQSLEIAKTMLAAGTHVWMAPEGTRSLTGELGPFKHGGFHLALDSGLPILPVSIKGTRDVLPSKTLRSKHGVKIKVTVHPEIETTAYAKDGKEGRERLMADVRRAIASGL